MIAVTGAALILSMFLAFSDLASRSLPRPRSTKTNRAGQVFMLVGPAIVISNSVRSISSLTGLSVQA